MPSGAIGPSAATSVANEGRTENPDGPPPRVVFVLRSDGFPEGMAATNRVRLLSAALASAGASVDVLCTRALESPDKPRNRLASGTHGAVRFEYTTGRTTRPGSFFVRRLVDIRGFLVLVARLRSMRRGQDPVIVYSWITSQYNSLYRIAALTALRLLGIPCVIELNEPPWPCRLAASGKVSRYSPLRGVSGAVAISRPLTDWAAGEAARIGQTVSLVRVPAVSAADLSMAEEPPRPGVPRVVLAAAPEYRSHFQLLANAMERVWTERDCELVVAGYDEKDPEAAWLADEPVYARHRDRIVLLGQLGLSELHEQYAMASVLVAPLDDTQRSAMTFPTKVAEYLMTGRPVITSDVGDVGELLRGAAAAYLIPPGDADRLADRLLEVLADPVRAEETGRAGRALALEELNAACYGDVLRGFFAAVVRGGAIVDPARGT
jgi:glycosyltransferase involved in cell wall biosynthesis